MRPRQLYPTSLVCIYTMAALLGGCPSPAREGTKADGETQDSADVGGGGTADGTTDGAADGTAEGGDGADGTADGGGEGTADGGSEGTADGGGPTDPAAGRPDRFIEPATGMELKLIRASTFDVGCTPGQSGCGTDEDPVMAVTITRDHYIGAAEVTQEQFEAALGYNPSYFGGCATCPVESITWHEAAQLANALSAAAGLTACYTCSGREEGAVCTATVDLPACPGYRMPTEAEWEGAARCGEDLLYAGGTDASSLAWYDENSGETTHPVARLNANACDLADMSGNVYEWVHDWWFNEYYTSTGRIDPTGPEASEGSRVARGGCWNHPVSGSRVANRAHQAPELRDYRTGVRLARTAP
jgi:formylglycine-generating enzyme required for sulfatase activity